MSIEATLPKVRGVKFEVDSIHRLDHWRLFEILSQIESACGSRSLPNIRLEEDCIHIYGRLGDVNTNIGMLKADPNTKPHQELYLVTYKLTKPSYVGAKVQPDLVELLREYIV